ncbi:hypothetical protein HBA55_26430 [Pseudomaricurvus alkylphenolicus]|uniref:hypothetical protein n=1 Tax=Pseudomaricurvus alkylphenolicus TaxID=1306991 RepID=UPI0014231561|nr:hypothetical protein [Pseudomaricurvus alkylphenolicus]NIB43172.1 hypothetical protein [Pseudomaricurvus alkylphenolicus]
MFTLKMIIVALVPMVTVLAAVVLGLMIDRKKISGILANWRQRYEVERTLARELKAKQAKLKQVYAKKLDHLRQSQDRRFKAGVSAFIEHCRHQVDEQLQQRSMDKSVDPHHLSSLKLYSTSLDATLDTFQATGPMHYEDLLAGMREQVIETIADSQRGQEALDIADSFQKAFQSQESERRQLRGLIEQVYRDGKVVVQSEKDELVLTLEKQLRDSIRQQKEMLLQLHRLESELKESYQEEGWHSSTPNMMG